MHDTIDDFVEFMPAPDKVSVRERRKNLRLEKKEREAKAIQKKRLPNTSDLPSARYRVRGRKGSPFRKCITGCLNPSDNEYYLVAEDDPSPNRQYGGSPQLVRLVPWLTKSLLKPNRSKKYNVITGRRSPDQDTFSYHSRWHSYRDSRNIKDAGTIKSPYAQKSKVRQMNMNISQASIQQMKKAVDIPLEQRTILNLHELYMAEDMISSREAKAHYFKHPNKIITEAMLIMLGYAQSMVDRGRPYDFRLVVELKNTVVNKRIAEWEERYQKRVISIPALFAGKFGKDAENGFRFSYIPFDTNIQISAGYQRNPERYVTNNGEFLTAVRKIMAGRIRDLSFFYVLDPVTAVTLDYCIRQFQSGYGTKPESIVQYKVPELMHILKDNGLLDSGGNPLKYQFFFSETQYHKINDERFRINSTR